MPPVAPKFVAYYRVSTQRQGRSGLGLAAQQAAVGEHLARVGGRLIGEFKEIESGKAVDRPKLIEAIRHAKLSRATLVIAKLDRLARNFHFLRQLEQSGLKFVCCDMPEANQLTVHILAAVAEDEARRISDRTKAALAAAKARGTKLGGDRVGIYRFAAIGARASAEARTERAHAWATDAASMIADIRGRRTMSLRQIASELNDRGFTTPRGKQWTAAQVQRVLRAT